MIEKFKKKIFSQFFLEIVSSSFFVKQANAAARTLFKQAVITLPTRFLCTMSSSDNNNDAHSSHGFSTNAIHVGQDPDKWDSHTVVTPIVSFYGFFGIYRKFIELNLHFPRFWELHLNKPRLVNTTDLNTAAVAIQHVIRLKRRWRRWKRPNTQWYSHPV